jgi:hypothetical protein
MTALRRRRVSISRLSRALARQPLPCESGVKRHSLRVMVCVHVLVSLAVAALLVSGCRRPETPVWPPNVERTDVTPAEWMVGCFALDPMTDRLRAAGAPEAINLTARRADVIEGRQRYRVTVNGSTQKYGAWAPLTSKRIRVEVGSPATVMLALSQSNEGLVGTYQEISDASPGFSPDIPVSLRRITCIPAPVR